MHIYIYLHFFLFKYVLNKFLLARILLRCKLAVSPFFWLISLICFSIVHGYECCCHMFTVPHAPCRSCFRCPRSAQDGLLRKDTQTISGTVTSTSLPSVLIKQWPMERQKQNLNAAYDNLIDAYVSRDFATQPWSKINKLKDGEHLGSHHTTVISTHEPTQELTSKNSKLYQRKLSEAYRGITRADELIPLWVTAVETAIDR